MKPYVSNRQVHNSSGAVRLVPLLILFLWIPLSSTGQNTRHQQEWRVIQEQGKRQAPQNWWQAITLDELHAYMKAGVPVNVTDRRGWTPLHSAARYNTGPDILAALLDAGAKVDARDRSGDTPLHWAAAANLNPDIVAALLEAGADVNGRDRFGWTALHTAASTNPNPDVISTLLAAGAKRNLRAYFILFSPKFLLKHNEHMSAADKERALAMLTND